MLFQQRFLDGIRDGAITLAFRRWRRPSVRSGGTLLTPIGQLSIVSVTPIDLDRISDGEALRAGYASRDELLVALNERVEGNVYRVELGPLHADPRVALRDSPAVTEDAQRDLAGRVARLDARTPEGPWTLRVMELIALHPGMRAGDLCVLAGQEMPRFKLNVRKLKTLGLTESLGIGYRLSPRGEAYLRAAHHRP